MKMLEILSKEMETEAISTRKMLSRIPDDKYDWQPHPKSMTIERLSNHIAELPTWVEMILNTDALDFNDNPYIPTTFNKTSEILDFFEESLHKGIAALKNASEDQLKDFWALKQGDHIIQRTTKLDFIRIVFGQIVHHRAQMGVFLRLLDVPIPGPYGPSADEHEQM